MTLVKDPFEILLNHEEEIKDSLQEEVDFIKQGKAEDAVLIYGMAHDLSMKQMIEMGRYRGRSWRFLSALADAKLEIEGKGILILVQQIVGNNLLYQATHQAAQTIGRLEAKREKYANNLLISAMYDRSMEYVADLPLDTVEAYWETIRRR